MIIDDASFQSVPLAWGAQAREIDLLRPWFSLLPTDFARGIDPSGPARLGTFAVTPSGTQTPCFPLRIARLIPALPIFPYGENAIYLYIHSDQSKPCTAMDEKIFSRPEIIDYLNNNITCIKLNPNNVDSIEFANKKVSIKELLKSLDATGYPSHYFFNNRGQLKGVRTGYIKLLEFKQLVKYIAGGHVEKLNFNAFLKLRDAQMDTIYGEF